MSRDPRTVEVAEQSGIRGLAAAVLLLCVPACQVPVPLGSTQQHVYSAPRPEELRRASHEDKSDPAGHVRISAPPTKSFIHPAVLTRDPAGAYPEHAAIPVAWQGSETGMDNGSDAWSVSGVPPEPRLHPSLGRLTPADLFPDEYLVDGGDRDQPVHYFGGTRQGFETEDTIAEYADHLGDQHVRASNRVAVYAPRFGAVRVIEGSGIDIQVDQAFGAHDVSAAGSLLRQDVPGQAIRDTELVAVNSRRRADGTHTHRSAGLAEQETRAHLNNKVDQGMEGRQTTTAGLFHRNQGPEFTRRLANAVIWTRETYPVLSASTTQAQQVEARFTAQATVGIDPDAEESDIRIIKLADREVATAGDLIQFTIRFINTGDYDLYDVRIVDNLTPRLQYVDDSAQTDRSGDVLVESNGEGSQVLTFVFDEPLPARASGTIEFAAQVR